MKHAFTAILILISAANWCSAQRRERGRDRERDRSNSVVQAYHSDTGEYTQDYGIFGDLNIFQRERHAKRPPGSGGPPPRTPEETYVLTGIVQDLDNQYRANFEDLSRGSVQKVSVGSPLARGKIGEIQQDRASYESGGKNVWVQIGNNLTGSSANVADASSGGGGPAMDPNAPGLTIEQRMRARRMALNNGGSAAAGSPQPTVNPALNNGPQLNSGGSPASNVSRPGEDVVNGPPQSRNPQNDGQPSDGPPSSEAAQSTGNNPSNGGPPGGTSADPDEPVITHNFPPLPAVAPGQGQ